MTIKTANNIALILRRYFEKQPVEKAWPFGSFARDKIIQIENFRLLVYRV